MTLGKLDDVGSDFVSKELAKKHDLTTKQTKGVAKLLFEEGKKETPTQASIADAVASGGAVDLTKFDLNGKNDISKREFAAQKNMNIDLSAFDTDGSQSVSQEEIDAAAKGKPKTAMTAESAAPKKAGSTYFDVKTGSTEEKAAGSTYFDVKTGSTEEKAAGSTYFDVKTGSTEKKAAGSTYFDVKTGSTEEKAAGSTYFDISGAADKPDAGKSKDKGIKKNDEYVDELVDSGLPEELAQNAVDGGAGLEVFAKKEKSKEKSKGKVKEESKEPNKEKDHRQAAIDELVAGGMHPDLAANAFDSGANDEYYTYT